MYVHKQILTKKVSHYQTQQSKEKVTMLKRASVVPIVIKEAEQKTLFDLLKNPSELNETIRKSAEFVLSAMLKYNYILMDDRKAVWIYHSLQGKTSFRYKVGESFPGPGNKFAKMCYEFCKEKVMRAIHFELLCSHQNRNPEDSKWGGSVYLKFKLIPINGHSIIIDVDIAPSGLKEWEDSTLGLVAYYHAGFIQFNDLQVQNILQAIDNSVLGQPDFLPKDMTIREYANNVFTTIDCC